MMPSGVPRSDSGLALPTLVWLKTSLPSSWGGITLKAASTHAPAAYVASIMERSELVEGILGESRSPSPYLTQAVTALAISSNQQEWTQLDKVDVPLQQHYLSLAIDKAGHQQLLASAPSICARTLTNSTSLPHAGDWLNGVPFAVLGLGLHDKKFQSCLWYWLEIPLHNAPMPSQSATAPPIFL